MKIEYLLKFASKADAHTALPEWQNMDDDDHVFWTPKFHTGIMETSVGISAVWDYSDPENPVVTTPEVPFSGYYLIISLSEPDPLLFAQPYTLTEYGRGADGVMIKLQTKLTPVQENSSAIVSPVFAGSNYAF